MAATSRNGKPQVARRCRSDELLGGTAQAICATPMALWRTALSETHDSPKTVL
jgi:hypothetical protein